MKSLANLSIQNSSEFLLTAYAPKKFLKEEDRLFRGVFFSTEEKLKLLQLDQEGAIYSTTKFPPAFLKKLDDMKIGFYAFAYAYTDAPIRYTVVLKSLRRFNPKYILLR